MFGRRRPRLDRQEALTGRPMKLPTVGRSERDDGKTEVTVELERPGWQRALGGSRTFQRTYRLDAFGLEVYDLCDGQRTVRQIVRAFADRHRLSQAEAEMAVTAFLKTMMVKGLVAVEMEMQ